MIPYEKVIVEVCYLQTEVGLGKVTLTGDLDKKYSYIAFKSQDEVLEGTIVNAPVGKQNVLKKAYIVNVLDVEDVDAYLATLPYELKEVM